MQQCRKIRDLADGARAGRNVCVNESDRPVLAARRKRATVDGRPTLFSRSHKQRRRRLLRVRQHPRHHAVQHPPLRHEPGPYERRGDRVLHDHRLEPAGPNFHPQGKRRRQRTRDEQPLRIAPPIAASVAPREQQPEKESRGVLPTVQDARRKHVADLGRQAIAQPRVLAHRTHQLPHHEEGSEIRHDQHDEPAHGPHHVAPQVGRGPLLQVQPHAHWATALDRNGRGLDGSVHGMKRRVRRRCGGPAHEGSRGGQLRLQLTRQGFHARPS